MSSKKVGLYLVVIGILLDIFDSLFLGPLAASIGLSGAGGIIIAILFTLVPTLGYWLIVFGILSFTKLKLSNKIIISLILEPGIGIIFSLFPILSFFGNALGVFAAFIIMIVSNNRTEQKIETPAISNPAEVGTHKLTLVSVFLLSAGISIVIASIILVVGIIFWATPNQGDFFGFGGGIIVMFLLMVAGIISLISFIVSVSILKNKRIKDGGKISKLLLVAKIISIIVIVFVILFVSRLFFFDYKGVPLIRSDFFCSIGNDKDQCLFNLAVEQSLRHNNLKYCEELYNQWHLDVNYVPWPNNEGLDDPVGKFLGISLYPNKCMQVFHQWFYINHRNKMYKEGLSPDEEIKVGQQACKDIAKVDGYDPKYPYNPQNCLGELRKDIYAGIVMYGEGVCEDLKKIEYNDGIYTAENCSHKIRWPDMPQTEKQTEISSPQDIIKLKLEKINNDPSLPECVKPILAADSKEFYDWCLKNGTLHYDGSYISCSYLPMSAASTTEQEKFDLEHGNQLNEILRKQCNWP